ncbi:YlxR family protein [Calidifontibacter terrae]
MRTCVGCRARDERSSLVRVKVSDGRLTVDERGRLPGRGAWLHPQSHCLERALQRRAFRRALRATSEPGVDSLVEWVAHHVSSPDDAPVENRKRV